MIMCCASNWWMWIPIATLIILNEESTLRVEELLRVHICMYLKGMADFIASCFLATCHLRPEILYQQLMKWCHVHSRLCSQLCSTDTSIIESCRFECAFLRICHMSTCRVYFNIAVPVQHRWSILQDWRWWCEELMSGLTADSTFQPSWLMLI